MKNKDKSPLRNLVGKYKGKDSTSDKVLRGDITDFYSEVDARDAAREFALNALKEDFYSTPDEDKYDWLDKAESFKKKLHGQRDRMAYTGTRVKALFGHKDSIKTVARNRGINQIKTVVGGVAKPMAQQYGVPTKVVDQGLNVAAPGAYDAGTKGVKKIGEVKRNYFG